MHARSDVLDLVAGLHVVPGLHLVARQLERGSQRGIEAVERGAQLGPWDGEIAEAASVEALRAVADRGVAARAHIGDDRGHGIADIGTGRGRARERATHVGGTTEIDTGQHGERLIVPAAPFRQPGIALPDGSAGPDTACHAALVSSTSDLALLSSIGAQIEEIGARITEMAERYGATPDSALAGELFGAERGLFGARRFLDRARGYLEDMT